MNSRDFRQIDWAEVARRAELTLAMTGSRDQRASPDNDASDGLSQRDGLQRIPPQEDTADEW